MVYLKIYHLNMYCYNINVMGESQTVESNKSALIKFIG